MDYGSVISNSFEYTKEALVGKWMQWVILAVMALVQTFTVSLIPLLSGYVVRVLAGNTPAPEIDGWGKLFVDGWKMNIIALVYMIPAILVFLVLGGLSVIAGMATTDPTAAGAAILGAMAGAFLAFLVAIVMAFIALFAVLRFAHTDSVGEAFNFKAIFAQIGALGWGTWIIAVIVLLIVAVVYGFVVGILGAIPFLGWLIALFLNAAFAIFYARYLAQVYEEAPASA
ncbi:DUF4013 domain-containing protein [Methanoculleus horonobensis]|jgi:hypothetical protein|uniref:DUF4013 domain-containing protein n=1 Tax=Methanoculleus horonobensis TaxID=528314 RepID=UPI000829B460|nr:DUF4013 domain-containing protein [Methanoculleus horonobensis]MDD3070983.1 DUF4013 domain-containing protein [Methanoculleus horonobensis]